MIIKETRRRLVVKTITWRILAAISTFSIALSVALQVDASVATIAFLIAALDTMFKCIAYYVHEVSWQEISFGKEITEMKGCCIWFTGLPGAGKTTIAKALEKKLKDRLVPVERLDGDTLRKSVCSDLGFTKEDRDENIRRVSFLSQYLSMKHVVLASFISPYKSARQAVREKCTNFIEVYVKCSLEECERRDAEDPNRWGMYAKARAGEISGVTGIDDPYEEPESPELVLDTEANSIDQCVWLLIEHLKAKGLVR